MATCFAGSRHLDERRRRRLAANPVQADGTEDSTTKSVSTEYSGPNSNHRSESSNVSHFPLRKLISPKFWKLWGIGLMGFLAGAAILRAGQFAAEAGSGTSDEFIRLFDPANGRSSRVYGSVMFALSGQLAMLIWWVRSRSPLDFGGQYRVWRKVAASGIAASLFLITDFHLLILDVIQRQAGMTRNFQLELCWLVPAAICAAFLFRMMHQEMRENRLSLILLWTAAASGMLAALQIVGYSFSGIEGNTQLLTLGTALFAQLGVTMSLLFHTRHVIYVSLDPPKKKTVSVRSLFQIRLPRLRLPRFELSAFFRRTEKVNTKEANQGDTDEHSGNKTTPAKQARNKRKSKEVLDDATTSTKHSTVTQVQKRDAQIEEFTQNMRVDEPIDNDLLKGLSKKQRRKLRKQRRQLQRTASHDLPENDDEN